MPARFVVRLTPSFQRDLGSLHRSAQAEVLGAVGRFEANPFRPPPKIKKLKGRGIGRWRLEVWPYRVRYDVMGRDVVLYRVRHRKDIYR